jgi:hypothetical protein
MRLLASLLYGKPGNLAPDSVTREEPSFELFHAPPGAQDFQELWGEPASAIFLSFHVEYG